jgi:hypothetical protein
MAKIIFFQQKISTKNVYLIDSEITENTVINMLVPKAIDLEINSTLANISVDNLLGFLSIDAAAGSVTVNNFNGKAEIDTLDAEANISGIFKELDVESSRAEVNVTLNKVTFILQLRNTWRRQNDILFR